MKEFNFGSLDASLLHIVFFSKEWFRWTSIFKSFSWRIDIGKFHHGFGSNRCYCPTGDSFTAMIMIGGFGFRFWYSRYYGNAPCCCDQALKELKDAHKEIEG